jgi:hypothetical protein
MHHIIRKKNRAETDEGLCEQEGESLTIAILVLRKRLATASPEDGRPEERQRVRVTYEQGEGLLELRDLLFGEGVGLQRQLASVSGLENMATKPSA